MPAAAGGGAWYEKVWVLALSLLCCWPIGLVFVWMNKRFTQKTKVIITAVVLVLALIGGIASATSDPPASEESSRTTTEAPATTDEPTTTERQTTTDAPTTTERPTTTAAPTTTRPPTTTEVSKAALVGMWYEENGYLLDALMEDLDSIASAAGDLDLAGMGLACIDLSAGVADARDAGPIPDDAVQAEWSAALDDYDRAADLCISGAANFDMVAVEDAAGYIEQATGHLTNATELLTAYTE